MKYSTILICIAVLFVYSCNHEDHQEHEEATFLASSPILLDTLINYEYVCQLHSIQHIELRTLESGYLQNIFIDEGQIVKKGQLLFQIMPIINEAEVQKSKAEVSFAEIEYLNTKSLADSNIVSKNELALNKARLEKAKAELALAQAHLTFTEIRAPFDGIIGRFNDVRLGSLVDEGELLTTLSDNSEMWAYFNVPEAEYLDYKSKINKDSIQMVRLLMANNKLFKYPGEIRTIVADFNNETGNIAFRATFPNPNGLLRHGETGNVSIPQPVKNALIIPQKSTYEVLDKKYVLVIDSNDIIRPRQISIGIELPHLYSVTKGLTVSDKILLEGLRKVKLNEKVHYTYQDPKDVISHLELYAE